MAQLEIQGKSIEMQTKNPRKSKFEADISFNTKETKNTDRIKSVRTPLGRGTRSDFTFDRVESEINDYFNEYHENLTIVGFKYIDINEITTFKDRPFDNYEY